MNTTQKTRMICEGALCVALSVALSYFKIPVGVSFGGFGGSIDLVMVPLLVFAFRWGASWGFLAGLAFGTLKYFLAGGTSISWVSLLLDYSVAYAFVGFAGLFRVRHKEPKHLARRFGFAAFIGCFGRFIIHFISGVTVYAQYMPESFMEHAMTSPFVYSILYNGTYMLPNTVLAVVCCMAITPIMKRLPSTK